VSKSIFTRIGDAFHAFAGENREAAAGEIVQKGSSWPFNRVPVIDGSGYIDKLNKPYADSVWVSRAIKHVSGPMQSVTLRFFDGDTEITNAPWLNFWKKPVLGLTQGDFIEALVGWLKLSGEAFIILPDEFTVPFPDRMRQWPQLVLARPDSIKAVKDNSGALDHWQFIQPSGKPVMILPEKVIQPKYWNPYDPIRGMSEYESARVASEADYLSGKFALNLARANGDTGVIVGVEGGTMPDDAQMEQIRNSLRLKAEKSRRGEFSSVFVPANLKVQDPQIRTPDAQFVAQRLENRHEIYIAFGLPPSMADVMASYSVGSASDRYRAIEEASMPTGKKVCEPISRIASLMAGREIEARFDWSEHPVLQSVRNEKLDAGTKLFDRGMPWKVISDYLHLDLPEFDGDDQGYIPATLLPVGLDAGKLLPEADPNFAEGETTPPPADDPVKDALRAIRLLKSKAFGPIIPAPAPASEFEGCVCGCSLNDEAMMKGRSEKEIKLWRSLIAGRRETMRMYASKFNRALMIARSDVLSKLSTAASREKSPVTKHVAADFMFNLQNFTSFFQTAMRSVASNALQKAGDQVFAELGKDDPWKMPSDQTIKFLKDRENKLAGVPDEVFDRVRNVIGDGLKNGDSLNDIASAVRGEFNDLSAGRAQVIASTETAAAYGKGRDAAMKSAGVQWKKWLTSGNSNVRAAHALMNGAIVGVNDDFTVINPKTGETDTIQHPGDVSGAPWNVINCHCVALASATGPDDNEI
jgi:hypothetical protein